MSTYFSVAAAALAALGLAVTMSTSAEDSDAAATPSGSEFEIWPDRKLPEGSRVFEPDEINEILGRQTAEHLFFVEHPTLTVHRPAPDQANGCAVVVAPGGGYNVLAIDKEGTEVAEWLTSVGVTAFVLKYRVPRRPDASGAIHTEPLQDLQRALRLVRHRADEFGIDSDRVGALGFSAGGHLALMAGMHSELTTYEAVDDADALSARPDFLCPIYAAYLGPDYRDDQAELGPLVKVTKETPPAFMAVTHDDRARGAQAALMLVEYFNAGVPAELHSFTKGGHGYGLRPSKNAVSEWPAALEKWLGAMKLLDQ